MNRSGAVVAVLGVLVVLTTGCSGGADDSPSTAGTAATEIAPTGETGSAWARAFVTDFADDLMPGARVVWSQALGSCSPVDAPDSGAAVEARVEWDHSPGDQLPSPADVAAAAAAAGTEPLALGEGGDRFLAAPDDVPAEARISPPWTDESAAVSSVVVQISVHDIDGADETEAEGWQWAGYVCDVGWPPPPAES